MSRRRQPGSPGRDFASEGFIRSVVLLRDRVASFDTYPYNLPAVRSLTELPLDPKVTFFVGENGAGKSTLVEAIAVAASFNAEGGSRNFNFSTRRTESVLNENLRLVRSLRRQRDGFFLRAESLYNVASQIDDLRVGGAYGGRSLHEQSHGESFIALATNRFGDDGLYLLDEPEAALSPIRQLSLLALIDDHVRHRGSQFVIATHSPILMAYPRATIYELSTEHGIRSVNYESTEHFQLTRDFLNNRDAFFAELFEE